jgi:uncharacterized protein YkwD
MTRTDSPRVCATRLQTMCIHVATMLVAAVAAVGLAALPAAASAHGRSRQTDQPRRAHRRHARHHRPRCTDSHARIGRVSERATQRATVCLLNVQRTEHGLPRLRDSRDLVHPAQAWTNTMVDDRAFSHGADFGARISAAGFDWSQIGENIADGYMTPSSAVTAWMRSLGHCQNILSPEFREVGAGFDLRSAVGGLRRGTWTLDLGLGMHQHARSNDWAPAEGCPDRS